MGVLFSLNKDMVYYFYGINNEMFYIYYIFFSVQGYENTLKIMLHKKTLLVNAVLNLEETNREKHNANSKTKYENTVYNSSNLFKKENNTYKKTFPMFLTLFIFFLITFC